MKKNEELVIITKTYDLILWSCNHTGRFPRQHRFVLGERIERPIPQSILRLPRTRVVTSASARTVPARFESPLSTAPLQTLAAPVGSKN